MDDSVRQMRHGTPDKNPGGRPRIDETAADALAMQRMLMQLRSALPHLSMLSGRPLTILGLACWICWRDEHYPFGAQHGLVPSAPLRTDELTRLRSLATDQVRDATLRRIDRYVGAAARGKSVRGVRLRYERTTYDPDKPHAAKSYRVGGLPGLFWPDVGVPIGSSPGEPTMQAVQAVSDAVEVQTLTVRELEEVRRRYAGETDQITICERVAQLIRSDDVDGQRAERYLHRRLRRAREFEFVHLGEVDEHGNTPAGKRLSSGAGLRHFGDRNVA